MLRPRIQIGICLLLLSSSAAASQSLRGTLPTNEFGAPVLKADGSRVTYTRSQVAEQERGAPGRPAPAANPPLDTGIRAWWGYAAFGSGIGGSDIVISNAQGRARVYLGGSTWGFGAGTYWHALEYSPATRGYEQLFISTNIGPIVRIAVANVVGGAENEIIVGLSSGEILFYDERTFALVGSFQSAATNLAGMVASDYDADGTVEILLTNAGALFVYTGSGTLEWQLNGAGGNDVVVGQMDTDAALEIATTSGKVVDAATRLAQWTYPNGFGYELAVGDIDSDGKAELIASEGWSFVWSYDVDVQLPKWSIPMSHDIGAIHLANVDGDPTLELLVGEGQWGSILAFNTVTQQQEWAIPNPEHGVTDVVAADVDNDGTLEVLWGAGASSTGPDHLYVANAVSRVVEWSNPDLVGFVGAQTGDVDGDGRAEIVTASIESDAGYSSGQILVFDGITHRLRGISAPIVRNGAWTGTHDLKLRNVDADPALEILVAADSYYDGAIEIYDFNGSTNAFALIWTNATRPDGSPFYSVDVADVDLDGNLEIIGGVGQAHTGSLGTFAYVYDYGTAAEEWHSFHLGGSWGAIQAVAAMTGGSGSPEILAMGGDRSIYLWDGATKEARAIIAGPFTSFERVTVPSSPRAFLVTKPDGTLVRYEKTGSTYGVAASQLMTDQQIVSTSLPSGGQLALGFGDRLNFFPSLTAGLSWSSASYGLSPYGKAAAGPNGPLYFAGTYALVSVGPPLGVVSVHPTSGPSTGGTNVTISGAGFSPFANVRFTGAGATGVTVPNATTILATTPSLSPGALHDVAVLHPDDYSYGALKGGFFSDFLDVSQSHPFHAFVEKLFRSGITSGCAPGVYCPDSPVLRSQMAAFLLRGKHGSWYGPPPATGTRFTDVPAGAFAAAFIEQLDREGITSGCSPTTYCPNDSVSRSQMAAFLLRTKHGSSYVPPPATGIFVDVPVEHPFAPWIEQLYHEGITAGCGPDRFCPNAPVSRGQMAVFLSRTLGL